MHDALLPLFPLNVVLLPQDVLPLHIFEDRYKEMVGESLESDSEFGIVLAAEGGIVNAGCTAAIDQVLKRHEDGRLDIVTVGSRRFHVHALNEERSFLRGEVEFFDDEDDSAPDDLRRQAVTAAASREGEGPLLSFDLARQVEDLEFRQQLLLCRSEAERLRLLVKYFPAQKIREGYRSRMQTLAVRNGHGKKGPAGIS